MCFNENGFLTLPDGLNGFLIVPQWTDFSTIFDEKLFSDVEGTIGSLPTLHGINGSFATSYGTSVFFTLEFANINCEGGDWHECRKAMFGDPEKSSQTSGGD